MLNLRYLPAQPGGEPPPPLTAPLPSRAAALAVYFQMHGGIGTVGFVGAWAASTLLFQLTCPLEYQPALPFAIPWWLMPWLPSFCIALTSFR